MEVSLRVPTVLRTSVDGKAELLVPGRTVEEVLEAAGEEYPAFRDRIRDENGELRQFLNIFVNGSDIRFGDGLATEVRTGDQISIIPSIAGG